MEILNDAGIIFLEDKIIGAVNVEKKINKFKLSLEEIKEIKYFPGFDSIQIQTELNKLTNPKQNPNSVKISMPNPDDIYNDFYKYRVNVNTIIMSPNFKGLEKLALWWNIKIDENKVYK